jgi:hypothetical protein
MQISMPAAAPAPAPAVAKSGTDKSGTARKLPATAPPRAPRPAKPIMISVDRTSSSTCKPGHTPGTHHGIEERQIAGNQRNQSSARAQQTTGNSWPKGQQCERSLTAIPCASDPLYRVATGQARVFWVAPWGKHAARGQNACATVSAPSSRCPASATPLSIISIGGFVVERGLEWNVKKDIDRYVRDAKTCLWKNRRRAVCSPFSRCSSQRAALPSEWRERPSARSTKRMGINPHPGTWRLCASNSRFLW